jgi:Sec-independent protein translocase protein TatA
MGEITVILLLALIFLGPKKLPDLAAGLGKLIKEIRKATSDVKNEIALDETFRKPFEELRDAVTLHPDELKRRDQWQKDREEAAKRAAEEAAKFAAESANGVSVPPDGLADHVTIPMPEAETKTDAKPLVPKLPVPHGPNDTIVQVAPPRGATLEDVPTPPPETTTAPKPPTPPEAAATKPAAPHVGLFPAGTVARPATLRAVKPAGSAPAPAVAPAAPQNNEGGANITQILREEDLIPSLSSGGGPPPPPHLPGLRPVGPPRPGVTPPLPPAKADKMSDKMSDKTSDKTSDKKKP